MRVVTVTSVIPLFLWKILCCILSVLFISHSVLVLDKRRSALSCSVFIFLGDFSASAQSSCCRWSGPVASELLVNRVSSRAVSKRFVFPASNITCSWIFSLHGSVSVSIALICCSWLSSIFHWVLLRWSGVESSSLAPLFSWAAYTGRFSLKRFFSSP
jgi:hypothetical protein